MVQVLKIAQWNANGLGQHIPEIDTFLRYHQLDILLISETRFTAKNYIKVHNYNVYTTDHPDGSAHGGTAVIIRKNIKHHESEPYKQDHLQATSVIIDDYTGKLTVSAVYCPPNTTIRRNTLTTSLRLLGKDLLLEAIIMPSMNAGERT